MTRPFAWLIGTLFGLAATVTPGIVAAQPLRVYAAGSLSAVFTEMVRLFPAPPDSVAPPGVRPVGRSAAADRAWRSKPTFWPPPT